jgi:hypothetical protein
MSRQGDDQTTLERTEVGLLHLSTGHDQLLAQQGVLGQQFVAAAEQVRSESGSHWSRAQCLARGCVHPSHGLRNGGPAPSCENSEHALGSR